MCYHCATVAPGLTGKPGYGKHCMQNLPQPTTEDSAVPGKTRTRTCISVLEYRNQTDYGRGKAPIAEWLTSLEYNHLAVTSVVWSLSPACGNLRADLIGLLIFFSA